MYRTICISLLMYNILSCSNGKEDIVIKEIAHDHDDHWGAEREYNEHHRVHLPLSHTASASIISQRVDRGVIDLPDTQRVVSDDSLAGTTVNVATTVDVNARCCNSNCCDDDKDNKFWCCC